MRQPIQDHLPKRIKSNVECPRDNCPKLHQSENIRASGQEQQNQLSASISSRKNT